MRILTHSEELIMKQYLTIIALVLLLPAGVFADEKGAAPKSTQLTWMKFEDGLAKAKKIDKKILVDVYTDWCGWCKRMDKETFNHTSVASYLDTQYVLVKLNAESGSKLKYKEEEYTEQSISRAFGVSGYPTMVFLDSKGEIITVYPGYVKADDFLPMIKFIGEEIYTNMKWDAYIDEYRNSLKGKKSPNN